MSFVDVMAEKYVTSDQPAGFLTHTHTHTAIRQHEGCHKENKKGPSFTKCKLYVHIQRDSSASSLDGQENVDV